MIELGEEILGDHLARAGRQEPGHVEAARPVVDAAHRDYVDVVKHEISGHAVIESGPGGDVAAQSEVEQVFALLLGDVDRVVRDAVRAFDVARDLSQQDVEIIFSIPIRHQDSQSAG